MCADILGQVPNHVHVLVFHFILWRLCRVRLSRQGRREEVERGEVIAGTVLDIAGAYRHR